LKFIASKAIEVTEEELNLVAPADGNAPLNLTFDRRLSGAV
jgi:hypothetical protein